MSIGKKIVTSLPHFTRCKDKTKISDDNHIYATNNFSEYGITVRTTLYNHTRNEGQ